MTWAQIWLLLDAHVKNQAREDKDEDKDDALEGLPERPDAETDPVGALRWDLENTHKLVKSSIPVPALSEDQINEACLKLELKLKEEAQEKGDQ